MSFHCVQPAHEDEAVLLLLLLLLSQVASVLLLRIRHVWHRVRRSPAACVNAGETPNSRTKRVVPTLRTSSSEHNTA